MSLDRSQWLVDTAIDETVLLVKAFSDISGTWVNSYTGLSGHKGLLIQTSMKQSFYLRCLVISVRPGSIDTLRLSGHKGLLIQISMKQSF